MVQDRLKGDLCIRPMMHSDFMIMVKWFNDSRVLDFYEGPSDLNKVINKYGPRVEGKHYVVPCIVEYKKKPIGYIQYYELQENDLKTYGYPKNQKIFGIDQFIGETQLWGKGLGTSMILIMLKYLCKNKSATKVVLEVETSNKKAVASYKKCGFTIIKELNNNLYLMEWLPTKSTL